MYLSGIQNLNDNDLIAFCAAYGAEALVAEWTLEGDPPVLANTMKKVFKIIENGIPGYSIKMRQILAKAMIRSWEVAETEGDCHANDIALFVLCLINSLNQKTKGCKELRDLLESTIQRVRD